jgi:hypothetical protein
MGTKKKKEKKKFKNATFPDRKGCAQLWDHLILEPLNCNPSFENNTRP